MTTTPNMSLDLPVVSSTLGPTYGTMQNTAMEVIDAHNHSPGSGAQLGANSLNIDSDLSFNSFNALGLRTARLTDQTSISLTASDIRALYTKSGNLFYVNSAGAEVQITNGSSIAGVSGSITGLTSPASVVYSSGTSTFSFFEDSSLLAKMNVSDVAFYEFGNATAQPVTIKSPASLGSTYSLTLPTGLPTTGAFMGSDASGNLGFSGLKLYAADGTLSLPSITFSADTDTGIYRQSTNALGFVTGGTQTAIITPGQLFLINNGSLSAPNLSFIGDGDTGIYSQASNVLTIAAGSALSANFAANQIRATDGSSSAPAYSFENDTDTGIYRPSANQVVITTATTESARFSSNGISTDGGTSSLRWRVFTGNISSAADVTFTLPSIPLSASGTYATSLGGTGASVIGSLDSGSFPATDVPSLVYFITTNSTTSLVMRAKASAGTANYRVVIFY